MENTMGKRIMAHRKRLGLTQDQLAGQLGVTAQAVSKWENDQSCPDVMMLPRLAALFGVTTDELLGVEEERVHTGEVVGAKRSEEKDRAFHIGKGGLEFRYDSGRHAAIGCAVLVLLVGALQLAAVLLHWNASFWDILWPSALLVFGVFGIFPKFSFFCFGCALFGGYFLLSNLDVLGFSFEKGIILPVFLLLFGLSLLVDALRKQRKPSFSVEYDGGDGDHKKRVSDYVVDGDTFRFKGAFGELMQTVSMPKLARGRIECSFGDYTVDFSEVEAVSDDCYVDAGCSFGELVLRIPRRFALKSDKSASFASVNIEGAPYAETEGTIFLKADASFGDITVQYI